MLRTLAAVLLIAVLSLELGTAHAADAPAPIQGDYVAKDFRFHDGRVMPELRLHYTTLGDKSGEPVLVLHGTAGTGSGLLNAAFGDALFGSGQPLDAAKYYVILPDVIGAGRSSKPSDGLRAEFPHYDYDDMIRAQHEMLTQGLGVSHLRLVIGNSMGGMETWRWGELFPGFMDGLVPMASQPTPMAGRNWMMRRLLIDTIRSDPAYMAGNYATQPPSLRAANVWFGVATSGGSIALAQEASTTAAADKAIEKRQNAAFSADANDFIWQWDASHDYDPVTDLPRITAPVLVINSADDERNPPETGLLVDALKTVKNATYFLIPASAETSGHGTTSVGKFYQKPLTEFLTTLPKKGS